VNRAEVLTLLSSTGLSVALSGLLVWLMRTWISERIRESVKHEYAEKMANINSDLRREVDGQLIKLTASIQRDGDRHRFSASSFSEVQKAAIGRKLDAIEGLWRGVLAIRSMIPPGMVYVDISTDAEFVRNAQEPRFQKTLGEFDTNVLANSLKSAQSNVELVRPFLGEHIWQLFEAYQATTLRAVIISFGFQEGRTGDSILWSRDKIVRSYIGSALGAKVVDEMDALMYSKQTMIRNRFERELLSQMAPLITGEEMSADALAQTVRIDSEFARLRAEADMEGSKHI
jgi:hypothetical protein